MQMADMELLSAACCVAACDGRVVERELALLKQLAERAGVGEFSLNSTIDQARRDPTYYQQQFRIALGEPLRTMKALLVVAAADGTVSKPELDVLLHFAEKLNVTRPQFDRLVVELKGDIRARRRADGRDPSTGEKPAPKKP